MSVTHIPVLREEVLTYLNPKSGGLYVDATIGLGGHSLSVLQKSAPTGKLIGIDQDALALSKCQKRMKIFKDRLSLIHGNFSDLQDLIEIQGVSKVDGVVFDLGVSSFQLDTPERGFSFQHNGPLDMRMNQQMPILASDIVNDSTAKSLVKIFREYGEERFAKLIAQRIVESRSVENRLQRHNNSHKLWNLLYPENSKTKKAILNKGESILQHEFSKHYA